MFAVSIFGVIYMVISLAGLVLLFWLAITAIRALNVYIAKNRAPILRDDPTHGARL